MSALDNYMKKNKKGSWKGPVGVTKKDQFAKKSGRKIIENKKDLEESEETGEKGLAGIKSGGTKKKQRTYLD